MGVGGGLLSVFCRLLAVMTAASMDVCVCVTCHVRPPQVRCWAFRLPPTQLCIATNQPTEIPSLVLFWRSNYTAQILNI